MKRLKVGLNGFGRIGRSFARIALDKDSFDLAAINTRKTDPSMLAYLLKYDSIYRTYGKKVEHDQNDIIVDGKKIATTQFSDPSQIPWDQYGVDLVIDATGAFEKADDLKKHLRGTVKKVILTVDSDDDPIPHLVLGANDSSFDFAGSKIISTCTCTTNCAALLLKVLDDNFKIQSGFITTTHAYTATQSLLDDANKNPTRSRAAGLNIVPTTTGAARAVVKTLPHLQGKIDGLALRVPVPIVSFADISVVIEGQITAEEVNRKFKEASDQLKGILAYETSPLVSSDYIGSPYSCIFDSNYTKVIGNLVKVFGWYDNEWGYSIRLVELVEKLANYF